MNSLTDRYTQLASDPDPARRRLGKEQLSRLQRAPRASGQPEGAALPQAHPDGTSPDLLALVEAVVGTLRVRSDGSRQGRCPWHASRSGLCLVIFPCCTRWWCSSCRRGGGVVAWVALTEGLEYEVARRRLRVPREHRR